MYAPWLAHFYPGVTPLGLWEIRWTTYVAMWDGTKAR